MNLEKLILQKYKTQKAFGEAVGCDQAYVSLILSGKRQLTWKRAQVWAEALDIKLSDFYKVDYAESRQYFLDMVLAAVAELANDPEIASVDKLHIIADSYKKVFGTTPAVTGETEVDWGNGSVE